MDSNPSLILIFKSDPIRMSSFRPLSSPSRFPSVLSLGYVNCIQRSTRHLSQPLPLTFGAKTNVPRQPTHVAFDETEATHLPHLSGSLFPSTQTSVLLADDPSATREVSGNCPIAQSRRWPSWAES